MSNNKLRKKNRRLTINTANAVKELFLVINSEMKTLSKSFCVKYPTAESLYS